MKINGVAIAAPFQSQLILGFIIEHGIIKIIHVKLH